MWLTREPDMGDASALDEASCGAASVPFCSGTCARTNTPKMLAITPTNAVTTNKLAAITAFTVLFNMLNIAVIPDPIIHR